MVSFKEARDETEYKRNAAQAKTEMRSRHRASWGKFVTHLEHETHRTQPKVYKNFKTNEQDSKGNNKNSRLYKRKHFFNTMKNYETQHTQMNNNLNGI